MTSRAFRVVESFEDAMARYAGATYGVSTASCTDALFLSIMYRRKTMYPTEVEIPARTYISVPAAIEHAMMQVRFVDREWQGVYELSPLEVYDGALRMHRGMYVGGLHCVSFHARKHLKIGRGGMVLTDDWKAVEWLKRARFDGRDGSTPFLEDAVTELGWNCYMTPEQAARGLQLLEHLPDYNDDLTPEYPDLRTLPVFAAPQVVFSSTFT